MKGDKKIADEFFGLKLDRYLNDMVWLYILQHAVALDVIVAPVLQYL